MHSFKHPEERSEFTFGFHPEGLKSFVDDNAVTFVRTKAEFDRIFEKLDGIMMGGRRSLIDKTECLRQMVGYGLTYRINPTGPLPYVEFAVYQRCDDTVEPKLAERLSLGTGVLAELWDLDEYCYPLHASVVGHEEAVDIMYTGELTASGTLMNSFYRGYDEAVEVITDGVESLPVTPNVIGFVMDSRPEKGYIGNTHVGFITCMEIPFHYDFDMIEDFNKRVGWFSPVQLTSMMNDTIDNGTEFEPWSKLIIERIGEVNSMLMGVKPIVSNELYDELQTLMDIPSEPNEALANITARASRFTDLPQE